MWLRNCLEYVSVKNWEVEENAWIYKRCFLFSGAQVLILRPGYG
jgi:hypothetical protein